VGAEEELFVLDAETLAPRPWPEELREPERLKPELFAAVVELTTGVCATAADAVAELAQLRAEAKRRAAAAGLVLAAAGTWPTAVPEEQELTPDPGYLAFAEYGGSTVRRQYCSGLHVHVGVESPEACMATLEAVLPWLPVVLALSANSPYLAGRESGLASTRAEILQLLPRTGAPPAFASYEAWERFAESLVELGLADQTTRIWWDVRPHPRLGTIEVRAPDQPTRPEATAAFVALLQALVAAAEPGAPADRALYDQNRWAAARFGRAAQLVHPDGGRLVAAPALLAELLDRLEPTLAALGSMPLVAPLAGLAQAEEQLHVGRSDGLRSLCETLVALT
jgi:carboxylate-amine ligase